MNSLPKFYNTGAIIGFIVASILFVTQPMPLGMAALALAALFSYLYLQGITQYISIIMTKSQVIDKISQVASSLNSPQIPPEVNEKLEAIRKRIQDERTKGEE